MDNQASEVAGSRRLIVAGQPRWAQEIAAEIRLHAPHVEVFVVKTPIALPLRVVRIRPAAVLIVGFRPGAPTVRGRAFDSVVQVVRWLSPATRLVRYWIGTDVDHAVREASSSVLTRAFETSMRLDRHLAVAPWLAAELKALGIEADVVALPSELPDAALCQELPKVFRALAYIAEGRFEYYGGPTILEAARQNPSVEFAIVNCTAPDDRPIPANVTFLGWRVDLHQLVVGSTVFIRLTQHDGMSHMVREALALERFVIWTRELTAVQTISPDDPMALIVALRELLGRHTAGTLRPNALGRRYALSEFDPAKLTGHLLMRVFQ